MRRRLTTELHARLATLTDDALMDALQDRGLVADCAVHLSDVPNGDLLAAITKLRSRYDL